MTRALFVLLLLTGCATPCLPECSTDTECLVLFGGGGGLDYMDWQEEEDSRCQEGECQ